jgi:hypothetical protein
MKYAEKELVSLVRDPTSVGVVVSITPGHLLETALSRSAGNHYQVYWSAGSNVDVDIEECWHTEEELTQTRK